MNDKFNQTGIENSTFGDRAQISIKQKIILPSVPKQVTENPHNLPNSGVAQFVGRAEVLAQLDQQLQKGDRVAISTLMGMGGIGKSELALQYAWQEWPKQTYRGGICWLNVADSDPCLSILSFAQIHLGLTLPEEGELVERVRYVWQGWLKNEQDQTLIIFDDVRDYQQVKDYLPPQADQRFKVIITTRLKELSAKIQTLHVDILQPEAALDLLRSYVTDGRIDDQLEQANLLCRDLGYLPLALELVARLLRRRTNWTIAKIREKLTKNGLVDQSLIKNPKFDSEMTAERGVKLVFDLSWQELETEPNTQKLAMYLSLFAFAPFPKPLIDGLFPEEDEEEIEEWLTDSLVHLNLVKSLGDGWYELHTLIRHYLRDKLEKSEIKDIAKKTYCAVMVGIAENIPEMPSLEDIVNIEALIDHIKITAGELNQWLENKDVIWLFQNLSQFYQDPGDYYLAETYCEKCLTLTQQRFGNIHPSVAKSLNNLASLYYCQGKYRESEILYLQSLNLWKQILGNEQLFHEHIHVAQSFNNLGVLYRSQGRYQESEVVLQEALDFCKQIFGNEHLYVASILNNLSVLYAYQKKHEQAEFFLQQALDIRKKLLENDNFYVASSVCNLGVIYLSQGMYEEAESLLKQSLENYQCLFGNEHLNIAFPLENLSGLYYSQRKYRDAEPLILRSLSINEKHLGADHPEVAQSLNNLAALYDSSGRYTEAETLYLRSLAIREKQLGENHLDVGTSLNNLAGLYQSQGKYAEAELLYRRAIAIFLATLGENHPNTQTVMMNYFQMLSQFPDEELNQRFPSEIVEYIKSLRPN